jgi:hypothetical protein
MTVSEIPNPNIVSVSYIGNNNQRRVALMTVTEAKYHWDRLPQRYRETYTVRPAELDDYRTVNAMEWQPIESAPKE